MRAGAPFRWVGTATLAAHAFGAIGIAKMAAAAEDHPKNGAKDIAEHLRMVHFSLLVACVVVILSLLGASPGVLGAAHDQFQKILAIRAEWQKWMQRFASEQIQWLKAQGLTWPDSVVSPIYINGAELRSAVPRDFKLQGRFSVGDDSLVAMHLAGAPIYFFVREKEILVPGPAVASGARLGLTTPTFRTLADFRSFWDSADHVTASVVKEISDVAYLVSRSDFKAEVRWHRPGPGKGGGRQMSMALVAAEHEGLLVEKDRVLCPRELTQLLSSSSASPTYNDLFCVSSQKTYNDSKYFPEFQAIVVPAKVESHSLQTSLRRWLAEEFHLPGAGTKFEETFRELDEITKDYQTLPFENAERIFKGELDRAGERVEFAGLRFPVDQISTWGGLIILVTQIYFWLHLRAFDRAFRKEKGVRPAVAWIALYPDRVARVVSITTVSVIPVAVIVFLCSRGWLDYLRQRPVGWLAFLSILVSAVMLVGALYLAMRTVKMMRPLSQPQ